jgi:hypothetical protein
MVLSAAILSSCGAQIPYKPRQRKSQGKEQQTAKADGNNTPTTQIKKQERDFAHTNDNYVPPVSLTTPYDRSCCSQQFRYSIQ